LSINIKTSPAIRRVKNDGGTRMAPEPVSV